MTREEAIRVLRNTAFLTTDGVATIERIKQAIETLEVVRCKDCMFEGRMPVCRYFGDDDYCSNGERKEEEE